MDRLFSLEIEAVICSLEGEIIPISWTVVVLEVGSVAGSWKEVSVSETGLRAAVVTGETMAAVGVSLAIGRRTNLLSGRVRGTSVSKVSQVSEAEPGFLEMGDAS